MWTPLAACLSVLCAAGRALSSPQTPEFAPTPGMTRENALQLGERMYREGLSASGEPLPTRVKGENVDGRRFTCAGCHLRSGLGSIEGPVIPRAITGPRLYKPLHQASENKRPPDGVEAPEWLLGRLLRPAYTDATLARALREGLDPAGRTLEAAMPRYALDERDMALLVFYLKHLSTEPSPGVNATTLRVATILAEDTRAADREAMLAVLEAHVRDRNAQPRRQETRARKGSFMTKDMYVGYRRLELVRWPLTGPPAAWRGQLEAHYRSGPVFALLGGIARDWSPIHAFCEGNRIPALLPITELPETAGGWYTLYFSKGLYQEGAAAARYLAGGDGPGAGRPVIEVLRRVPEALALSRGFREAWRSTGRPEPVRWVLDPEQPMGPDLWRDLAGAHEGAVVLLWLGAEDLTAWDALARAIEPSAVFLSAGLLGDGIGSLPADLRRLAYLTYPFALPSQEASQARAVGSWLRVKGLPLTNPRLQARMYFLGWMLSGVLAEMRNYFYRDYFLEAVDMTNDQTVVTGGYPRLSFGPGQRYASKGCYVVRLGEGPTPELQPVSGWVVQ